MIDAIIGWSLRHRFIVLLGALLLLIVGYQRLVQMPLDVFPELTAPSVTVVTEAHGMVPEEVEKLITFPVETSLNGASGVRRVRSSSAVGISVVWVEFDWGVDVYRARQVVSEKLQLVRASLPPDVDPPVMAPISSIMGEILFIGLRSQEMDASALRTLADWQLRPRLLSVPGVSQVVPIGGGVEQFQVRARPADLMRYGVSIDELALAVSKSNENTSAGFYQRGGQEYLIYGVGRASKVEDLKRAVVRGEAAAVVLVQDVADVVIGHRVMRGDASINHGAGVILGIQKQPGANTLALSQRLEVVLDDVERGLPKGVTLERKLLRQADFIETSITNIKLALRDGSILVVLIVGAFLLSIRATAITALTIPLSLIVSMLVLEGMGQSLNTMTLGGMAIAVGALVDDAIVDVENVVRRLRERFKSGSGVSAAQVVFLASKEIRSSIVFATLIIVLVFLPLFFLEGVEGRLLAPLGVAYVVSLGASLLVALTVTPVMCAWLLPSSRMIRQEREPWLIAKMRRLYERILTRQLGWWRGSLALSIVGVVVASVAVSQAGRTFLPEFNEGALTISVVTMPGTSLQESNALGARVEAVLLAQPEVVSTARRTGRAELDEHAQGIHASEIDVRLRRSVRGERGLNEALRADFGAIAGANIIIGQPISHRIDHMISGTRANIAVKIYGPELGQLGRLAEQVKAQMETVEGVVDLAVEEQTQLPQMTLRFKREALAQHGLMVRDVAEMIEAAFYGRVVSKVLVGQRALDLVVMYPERSREDLQAIKEMMVPTPSKAWVPLEALVEPIRTSAPNQISRENTQRKIVVMCNVGQGKDLISVVKEIQRKVSAEVVLGQTYRVEYGGQFEAAQEATRVLIGLGLLVIVGIVALLYMALSSWRDTLLVMLNLPLALIGGAVGVFVSGGVVSIASLIGFITLFGIAARNGIMMVTHIRALSQEAPHTRDATTVVLQGASERLAPILMTALATGFGLLPLALAGGEPGNELQAPMAVVILFGLMSSTTLNMFVVPSLMWRFGRLERDG